MEQELIVINGKRFYPVSNKMIEGTKSMGDWYKANGNVDKYLKAEYLCLYAQITRFVDGQSIGIMKAYANRFDKLVTAVEVA